MNKEIYLYLEDIKGYVNSVLLYLNTTNNDMDIKEIIMYLSSVEEIIDDINNYLYDENKIYINKNEIINYLYYLEDKIDEVYKHEVSASIDKFIKRIKEGKEDE